MADTSKTDNATTKRKQVVRPIVVVYRVNPTGEPDIVEVTRDAYSVIEMMDKDDSLRYKKIDKKIGR